mmetsp:Transcript_55895/g.154797  ORF Transcript_55895/g.154797 Transcript_55895/m.154797 type:complete len:433 (-) Transcript_55895:30-1328(-)
MRCFTGVAVGFPAGASAYHTKDTWQNANWVLWSTGELRVDGASFGLIFSPSGGGRLAAKPLGCLIGAAPVASTEPGGLRTFVATTNDSVHSLIRLNFQTPADEEAFVELAKAAELACCTSYGSSGSRRSTIPGGRRSSAAGQPRDEGSADAIAAHVSHQCPGSWPLVYCNVELYGPDPNGECGSEVLLERGAVVLIDPQDAGRIGNYELLFCEENSAEVCLRLPIGPRTKLTRQQEDAHGGSNSRLSVASRRLTMGGADCAGPACTATVFGITLPGAPGWSLAFDSEKDAAGFERDFLVRYRLQVLSLKTSRGCRTVGELQGELMELRKWGFLSGLRWLTMQVLVLSVLALVLYSALLYSNDPDRALADVMMLALQDASTTVATFGEKVAEAGTVVCGFISRAVPLAAIERCTALPDAVEARSCIMSLVHAA